MDNNLYTIGQVANICGITTEQLRHYDKKNILKPLVRAAENQYRYYTERQIEDVLLIKELKRLGLPLKTISTLINNKELTVIKNHLQDNMQVLRRELITTQRRYNQLIDMFLCVTEAINILEKQHTGYAKEKFDADIQIVDVPLRKIIFTRYISDASIYSSFIHRYAELLSLIDRNNYGCFSPICAVFHNHYSKQFMETESERNGDLELFMNVEDESENRHSENTRMFGGFKAAMTVHIGDYKHTNVIYDRLTKWALSQGYRTNGISFQEFVVGRTITDKVSDFITRIYLPINCFEI